MATYRQAGVDLDAAVRLVDRIRPAVISTWTRDVVGGFGGFAAGLSLPPHIQDPVLFMSTDGVGTKAQLAAQWGLVDGLGWDLVAMCVDDLAAAGVAPLAMTNYLAVGSLDVDLAERLIGSVAAACRDAGVVLLGGETAEHPGEMPSSSFDISGTAVGVTERGREISGSAIDPGDLVIGIESPNLRSNGYSLVRHVLPDEVDASVRAMLLEPSVVYAPAVMGVVESVDVHGLAHITGGGLSGNLIRILPENLIARIDAGTWRRPEIFDLVATMGAVPEDEMWRTFNMGIGFVVVVPATQSDEALVALDRQGLRAQLIGEITPGERAVTVAGSGATSS